MLCVRVCVEGHEVDKTYSAELREVGGGGQIDI